MQTFRALVFLMIAALPGFASATTQGEEGLLAIRHCVMENNAALCHAALTPASYPLFDRFTSYKLMPCLPTDFTYAGEQPAGDRTTVKATMQASGSKMYVIHMVFIPDRDGRLRLDIPETLHRGMGENWQNKIQLSEQIYLMMKQNMGDKLTCDDISSLIEIKK